MKVYTDFTSSGEHSIYFQVTIMLCDKFPVRKI